MSAAFVKSLTRQIEERMGSGAKAAAAAGVSQGRWSDYVNDTNPIHGETTIPLHRFMKVAGPDEKSALLSVWSQDFATPGDCLNTEASQVTEASAELQRVVREAKARAGERERVRQRHVQWAQRHGPSQIVRVVHRSGH